MVRFGKKVYTKGLAQQSTQVKQGYVERGLSDEEADARAWATVNKVSVVGSQTGAGRKQSTAKRKTS